MWKNKSFILLLLVFRVLVTQLQPHSALNFSGQGVLTCTRTHTQNCLSFLVRTFQLHNL